MFMFPFQTMGLTASYDLPKVWGLKTNGDSISLTWEKIKIPSMIYTAFLSLPYHHKVKI